MSRTKSKNTYFKDMLSISISQEPRPGPKERLLISSYQYVKVADRFKILGGVLDLAPSIITQSKNSEIIEVCSTLGVENPVEYQMQDSGAAKTCKKRRFRKGRLFRNTKTNCQIEDADSNANRSRLSLERDPSSGSTAP